MVVVQTDRIYQELSHPTWSTRLLRAKAVLANRGSGDFNMLYLVDVRRVSIPLKDAIPYYEREGDRLGFKEFHVDAYDEAARKFRFDWEDLRLDVPHDDDVLILTQNFPVPDGNIRRHEASNNKVESRK